MDGVGGLIGHTGTPSTPPVPGVPQQSMATQGALPNYKNLDADHDREALGRSRGGVSTKVHLVADRRCRPQARVITAGQCHDSIAFDAASMPPSPNRTEDQPRPARPPRRTATALRFRPVPTAQHRRTVRQQAQGLPRCRDPYDKRDYMYLGTIDVASIKIWLENPSHDLGNTP